MPSIILSDNGVSSGSAGLKSTAASDGALALQTTTAGGTATTAVYVDTSQLVGLGTTPAAKLHLLTTGNTTADGIRLTLGSEGRSHNIYSALATGRDLTIAPYRSLTINTGSGTNEGIVTLNSYEYTVFGTGSSYTERMRLDSSGRLFVGYTGSAVGYPTGSIGAVGYISKKGTSAGLNTSGNCFNISWADGLTGAHLWVDTSDLGQITVSSDYRIKKNIESQTAPAIDRLMQLRSVKYELADYGTLFKADGVQREGFIAHELQEIIPSAVDGEKDAENQIQSLRLDALCSVMVKAIQELKAELDTAKEQIAILQGAQQ